MRCQVEDPTGQTLWLHLAKAHFTRLLVPGGVAQAQDWLKVAQMVRANMKVAARDDKAGHLVVQAGTVHGLTRGSVLALFGPDDATLDVEEALGRATVKQVGVGRSVVVIDEGDADALGAGQSWAHAGISGWCPTGRS